MKQIKNNQPIRKDMRLTANEKVYKLYSLTPKERNNINTRIKEINNGTKN